MRAILYNFQTLIGSGVALLSAGVTIYVLHIQIRQSKDQERDRIERRNIASRSMLPAALSEMNDYSTKCVRLLTPLLPDKDGDQRVTDIIDKVPEISQETMIILRECIEFAGASIRENLADMIVRFQIQHSRILSAHEWSWSNDKIIVRANLITFITDALEIHARSDNLFDYARRKSENPQPLTINSVVSAAHACDIWDNALINEITVEMQPRLQS